MKPLLIASLSTLAILPVLAFSTTPLPLSDTQIALLQQHFPTEAKESAESTLYWRGDALPIRLPIGKEKRLIFSETIQADLNSALTAEQLGIINNDQNLYLTAKTAFPQTRLYVTLKNSGQIILLDLITATNAANAPQTIKIPGKKEVTTSSIVTAHYKNTTIDTENMTTMPADTYVNAVRFAWQQLYAPERFLTNPASFTRTPLHTLLWLSHLVYGDKVLAHPLASWMSDHFYITAIELRNKYAHTTKINIAQDVCGNWQAATLYPQATLQPSGNVSDSATLFLISSKPFHEVIEVCHGHA